MDRIFWLDLEMTGLDPEQAGIIEFAGIVTDLELKPLGRYHSVVFQPQEELDKMDSWNVKTHTATGLIHQIPGGKPLVEVEREAMAFLKPFFGRSRPILAGNSIHQDRRFIDRYMLDLSKYLHYRMIDVSSFKEVFRSLYKVTVKKRNVHRAFDDIMASIEELQGYLQFINVPGPVELIQDGSK